MPLHINNTLNQDGRMLERFSAKLWFRATLLLLFFVLMIFLSSTNFVRLKDKYKPQLTKDKQSQINAEAKELIQREHEKAMDEIKTSLEQMDTWYHYKFILIGGVI